MKDTPPMLFALSETMALGRAMAEHLGVHLAAHEERQFEDGEHKIRALQSVRGADVYVVQSLASDASRSANDKLCRLLFFMGSLRDAGAERLTAVVPYLCYARKDRKTKARDPVTTRYIARLLESVGSDRVVTLDVHNLAAYQNAFQHCRSEHVSATELFSSYAADTLDRELVIVSPDAGGAKRADSLRVSLGQRIGVETPMAFMEKQRSGGVVSGSTAVVGRVHGKTALVVDDLVSTGTTLVRAAEACLQAGAQQVWAAATHGVFTCEAEAVLSEAPLQKLLITDSISPLRLTRSAATEKVEVLSVAALLGDTVGQLNRGEPLTWQ